MVGDAEDVLAGRRNAPGYPLPFIVRVVSCGQADHEHLFCCFILLPIERTATIATAAAV